MKKVIFFILLTLGFNQGLNKYESMTYSEKMELYNSYKKDVTTAMMTSFIIPTAGHAYTDNWLRGFMFYIPVALTTYLMIQKEGEQILEIAISGGIMHGFQVIDSGRLANKYNQKLYKEIFGTNAPSVNISYLPSYNGANVNFTYNF